MDKATLRMAWVEINTDSIRHNIREIRKKAGPKTEVTGIIKADAYGHGALEVARILKEEGIKSFGVATLEEALSLRKAGIKDPIILLGLCDEIYWDQVVDKGLTPVVCDYKNAEALSRMSLEKKTQVEVYLAVDSGMGRIGYLIEEEKDIENTLTEIKKIHDLQGLTIRGLFSHMASADSRDKSFTEKQNRLFMDFYNILEKEGIRLPEKTLANSASVMEVASVYYDRIRPGIILYGQLPSDEVDPSTLDLRAAMSVKAKIILLKEVEAGFSVSYGRTFITRRKSKIATLPLGYADGLPRNYSNRGKVIVNGHYAPIVGNICMDQCMIDVTDIPGVALGDLVIIMGKEESLNGGREKSNERVLEITAMEIGKATGTINYEIVCRFGQRLPKVYLP